MRRIATVASLVAAVVLALAAPGAAQAKARPTFRISHTAVHAALDTYAQATDGHLVVGPCDRRGELSVVCRARIDGPAAGHYRVIVTRDSANYVIRVRRI